MKPGMRVGVWVAMAAAIGTAALAGAEKAPAPVAEDLVQDVQVVVGVDTLFGTLVVPGSTKPVPLVLVFAGSGPTDRDGNTTLLKGKNDCYRMLADSLRERGIATLRYDKRGVGQSWRASKSESELKLGTYVDDAMVWARTYRHDPRFKTLIYLGHSEGALIATLAAKEQTPDALVLVAGAGRPAKDVIHEQLRRSVSAEIVRKSDAITDTLVAGKEAFDIPPILMSLYRPSIQPYMRSWLAVDPAAELKSIKVPTMVIWGTSDIQISRDDFDRLAAARGGIDKLLVTNMNHVLKPTLEDPMAQMSSYSDSTIMLHPHLLPPLTKFLRGVKRS